MEKLETDPKNMPIHCTTALMRVSATFVKKEYISRIQQQLMTTSTGVIQSSESENPKIMAKNLPGSSILGFFSFFKNLFISD